jgi:hypothetical protein
MRGRRRLSTELAEVPPVAEQRESYG